MCAKHYENPTMLSWVTAKNVGDVFLRHTVLLLLARSSSVDEIANVNFFNDDIVHVLQNTIDSRINSATGQRSSSQMESKHHNKENNGKAKLKR